MEVASTQTLAEQVRLALESADLDRFSDLLDPRVTWGAPGDPAPSCQNRAQVLAWYAGGRAAGRRFEVRDVTAYPDRILVAVTVTMPDGARSDRWQVLTVAGGRVVDIRAYDDEGAAVAAAYPGDRA